MKPKILVISELYPNKAKPALGIFVERQVNQLKKDFDIVVVSPIRVFPPLKIFKNLFKLKIKKFFKMFASWYREIKIIPYYEILNGVEVYYPRYTSLPRQFFHSTWGFFLFVFQKRFFEDLQKKYKFNLIHAHYATAPGLCALFLKRKFNIPVVLSVHGSDVTYTVHQNWVSRKIIKYVFDNVDFIATNSTKTTKQVLEVGGCKEKIEIVPLGGEFAKQNTTINNNRDTINILTIAYLEERKGHIYVLKALKNLVKKYKNLRYYIVGNGPQEEFLKKYVNNNNLSQFVRFEGYKPHHEALEYYKLADIFVLPSWNEAFGVVYLEALANEVPVIGCYGEGGPEDLKKLGDCIRLVKPKDSKSIEQELSLLIESKSLRERMAIIGRNIVMNNFTWEKSALKLSEIYKRLI